MRSRPVIGDGTRAAPGLPWPEGTVAAQQPEWKTHPDYVASRAALAAAPALVTAAELDRLRRALAVVAGGGARMVQLGDCAESFGETGADHVRAKTAVLHALADELGGDGPVLRVGRIGGQFAKPRSSPFEDVDGVQLPAFRGHMVNGETPSAGARAHDPRRMVRAYEASAEVLRVLARDRDRRAGRRPGPFPDGPWSSHDALVIDYEAPLVRTDAGRRILASTHLPWLGDRTRAPGSAHVRLLSQVANPVALKLGPSADPGELAEVCALLDPDRTPGRLTLIARMGAERVAELLPPLVAAVRARGHRAVWLSDPMHGNTVRAGGVKTRHLSAIVDEAVRCKRVLEAAGEHPGGLHLEVAASDVTECLGGKVDGVERLAERYTTLCDPRLNPDQAAELMRTWIRA
ncbi:3-deoxy-7-phosphoheptulonate synthase [Streptomyces botrytidirepellens]|uniref:Phospho-2-dehydro-3-deoxyheptonate aldolase n=1 Tax=Streptomyces botrytidirepellens TaxID=2486417 RepID=A0A3M8VKW0_9ACTN|nr:3-deoxy-7-phosphoheptulonate synthase [Streptomyces botrytidirepellens]RNG18302.1 phospho-2-dehydro-3-deoxyheptonate aldolase [Streptomyces botrytidirepellens]